MKIKLLLAGAALALLSGCGGYDPEACFQSAVAYMEQEGGTAHLIPGKSWTYLGISGNAVFYLEAMAHHHCDLTTIYQVNR